MSAHFARDAQAAAGPESLDPERDLRAVWPRDAAPFVLVTGGKGGVGKSTLAANLGVELAASGHRVLLVDLDLGLADLELLLGVAGEHTIEDALAGSCELADCVVRGPGGVALLPAGSGSVAMGRPDAERRAWLLAGVARLARDYELVIGDSAAGIGHDVLAFAAAATRVLVVATPDPASLADAYGFLKALDGWGREQGLEIPTPEIVVNQVTGLEEGERIARRLREASERFLARSPRQAGWLPDSWEVARSVSRRDPFVLAGESLARTCLVRLARRLERSLARSTAGIPS